MSGASLLKIQFIIQVFTNANNNTRDTKREFLFFLKSKKGLKYNSHCRSDVQAPTLNRVSMAVCAYIFFLAITAVKNPGALDNTLKQTV